MRGRMRMVAVGAALGLTMTLAGCAASGPEKVHVLPGVGSSPAETPAAGTTAYDLTVHRSFLLSDGTTAQGCVSVAVERDPQTDDGHSAERIRQVRALIVDHDWQDEQVSLDELGADERAVEKDRGESEAVMLSGVLSEHITKAVTDAGLLGRGVQLRGRVGC